MFSDLSSISINSSNDMNLNKSDFNSESEIEIPILNEIKFINNSIKFNKKYKADSIKSTNLGRKPKRVKSEEKGKKCHDRNSPDNMLIKVNGHFITFIIDYVNTILDIFDFDEKFKKIDFQYKAKITTKNFALLKNSNIEEILKKNISSKFCNQPNDYNKKMVEKLININPIINKLFSQNYINLFTNVYFKSERIINLNNYGLNMNLILPKNVRMYKNLLEKEDIKQNPEYIKKLNKFVQKYFLDEKNL